MPDLTCPTCARPVAEGEIQRGARRATAPQPAAVVMALEIVLAAARAGMLPKSAFWHVAQIRVDLAGRVTG